VELGHFDLATTHLQFLVDQESTDNIPAKVLRCAIEARIHLRQGRATRQRDLPNGPICFVMVTITLQLDDETARQLSTRATLAGMSIEDIAARELSVKAQDPFEFVGIGEADVSALNTDRLLAEGFGSK
jgi:hypothetical protein